MKKKILFTITSLLSIISCSSSKKTMSKVYIDDAEMKLALKKVEKAENAFLLYREGASGVNGGKSGGGCGCN
jgi:hypothetical protein